MIRLVVATGNAGKVREITRILDGVCVEIVSLADFPSMPEPEETGSTFAENAAIKARYAVQHTGLPALADDSGLEVDALGGQPGIYSSRFAGPNATDKERYELLLSLLADVPDDKRTARFKCAAALAFPSGELQMFEGVCEGVICKEPHGANGFGYDPVFFLPQYGLTMAEVGEDLKNEISHRGKAMLAARAALEALVSSIERAPAELPPEAADGPE